MIAGSSDRTMAIVLADYALPAPPAAAVAAVVEPPEPGPDSSARRVLTGSTASPPSAQPPTADPTPEVPAQSVRPAVAEVVLQPVPAATATAVLPKRPLDQEREWLRRTLSEEFDRMASSVSRITSEQPGLQWALYDGRKLVTDWSMVSLLT